MDSDPGALRSSRRLTIGGLILGVLAFAALGYDLRSEAHWNDESAFISQSYFFDLLREGARDDPAWISYPAIDLPPLPKYFIGLMLRIQGYRRPQPREAMAWYWDPNLRFETPEMLLAARWPSVIQGALGFVAVYGLGTLCRNHRTEAVAALLLVVNPLYRLQARRAVADVPCEALVLSTTAVALWFWQRTLSGRIRPWSWIGAVLGVGMLAGLAVLAKLNGGLALMTIGCWTVLALALPRMPAGWRLSILGSLLAIGAVALVTFVLLNLTLTARPVGPIPSDPVAIAREGIGGRLAAILRYRVKLSDVQRDVHSDYALVAPWDKLAACQPSPQAARGSPGNWLARGLSGPRTNSGDLYRPDGRLVNMGAEIVPENHTTPFSLAAEGYPVDCPSLRVMTATELAEAADANLITHLSWVHRHVGGMRVQEDDELVIVDSGLPCDTFNVVTRARLTALTARSRVAAAVAYFHIVSRPFSWWVGPADRPADLEEILLGAGLVATESELAMAADLDTIDETAERPPGLRIVRAQTPEQVGHYAAINAANWDPPDPHVLRFCQAAIPVLLSADSPLWLYVGYLGEQPVAAAELTLSGGVAGLYGIATRSSYRRRGFGTAMTLRPLIDARAAGYRTAVLQAAPEGVGIYARLGFAPTGRYQEYKPPDPA
jgi:hypothetical protein